MSKRGLEAKREHEEDDEPFWKQEGRVGVLGVDQEWGMSGPGPYKTHEIIRSGPTKAIASRTQNSATLGAVFIATYIYSK